MAFGAEDVVRGAVALATPLIDAGFSVERARRDARYGRSMSKIQQKRYAIAQQRQAVRNMRYTPKGMPIMFILLGVGVVIAMIVGLAVFASSSASRSSQTGAISTAGGKRVRRVRKRP